MTQAYYVNSSGMFSQFKLTRVIRTADLNYGNMLRALDSIKETAPFHMESLAIVEKTQKNIGGRILQNNILKAVLMSKELYEDAVLAFPAVVPYTRQMTIADDFFMPDDRFSKVITQLAPSQTREIMHEEIPPGAVLTVGVPFVAATLHSSIVPVLVDGPNGTIAYNLGDVGQLVNISFVTEALHSLVLIKYRNDQTVTPTLVIENEIKGVLMGPALASLYGISLPPY